MKTIITADIHLEDESVIRSMPMESGSMRWEALDLDGVAMVYISTREQAERLFDEVSDLTMRWRERDPEHFRVDAITAPACTTCRVNPPTAGDGTCWPCHTAAAITGQEVNP